MRHGESWNIIMPSLEVFFSILFFFVGLYTFIYFKKHMSEEGQLKNRKANYNKVILLFVSGYSIFLLCLSLTNLLLAIDCQKSTPSSVYHFMVIFVNILRPVQFAFTLSIVLWNVRFRRKFKMLVKNILSCKCFKPKRKDSSKIDDSRVK